MKRYSSLVFMALVACGGPKPTPTTTPLPPEPDPKPVEAEKVTPPPPPELKPVDVPIPAAQTTLKLVKPGTGKKAILKVVATQGAKQHVELDLDFAGKQTSAKGIEADTAPTLVLASDVEVGEIGADGNAKFTVTVGGVDAKDRPGAKSTAAQFKQAFAGITGISIGGSVGADGKLGDMAIHVPKPDRDSLSALNLVKLAIMPMWPQLPTDPIGVGAKWTVTFPYKIADKLDSTQTVEFELVSHKGTVWEIKGKIKVAGADQQVDNATLGKIGGAGTIAMTLTDGAFLPTSSSTLASDFTATGPAGQGSAAPESATFHLEQGFAVSPK
jgi:hypothetical protein